uniref:Putative agap013250-pa-like protein n=1 Tax=Anopheles darlingi TaxID=43151 RepID=A0A2M4CJ35_ANODA
MRPMLRERNENASALLRRILEEEFDQTVVNFIRKQDTQMRLAITPKDKLIITLRFLAAGQDYKSLEYSYRVSKHFGLLLSGIM